MSGERFARYQPVPCGESRVMECDSKVRTDLTRSARLRLWRCFLARREICPSSNDAFKAREPVSSGLLSLLPATVPFGASCPEEEENNPRPIIEGLEQHVRLSGLTDIVIVYMFSSFLFAGLLKHAPADLLVESFFQVELIAACRGD